MNQYSSLNIGFGDGYPQLYNSQLNQIPFYLCNRLNFNNSWYSPKMYIYREVAKEFSPRKIYKDGYTDEWKVRERNDRLIIIGRFRLNKAFVVNAKDANSFEAYYCNLEYNNKIYPITLSEKEFKKRAVLPHLSFIKRNPDCPDKYLVAAFFLAVQECTDTKFLQTPCHSGWNELENGELTFASNLSVHPHLYEYYPEDIRERKLVNCEKSLWDISKEYAKALPKIWQYKFLVAIRLASLLLYFFAKEGIKPDQLLVVEPASESASKAVIALLKTQNYESQVVLPLTATRTELNTLFSTINDGVAIVIDSSYVENWKRRDDRLQMIIDEINNANGYENGTRHIVAIIATTPGNLPSEIPAMYINMTEQPVVGNTDELQRLSGEFDCALISAIINDPQNNRRFIENIVKASKIESQTISNSENFNIKRLIRGGVAIMEHFNLISPEEIKSIYQWLKNGNGAREDTSTAIVNDFRSVLNGQFFNRIQVVSQEGQPYYQKGKNMAFATKNHINFETSILDKFILPHMKKTQKRLKLLQALNACGLLYYNNGFKRNLDVEITSGEKETVSVYSVSKSLLNDENTGKLNTMQYRDYLVDQTIEHIIGFRPMLTDTSETTVAGVQQLPEMDLNYHQYSSGVSRSGKTKYLCEQAISGAMNGEQIIIIDHSDSFSEKELNKHMLPKFIDEYVSRWDISKQGLPIKFENLDYYTTLPDKKQHIFSILAAAARVLGDMQAKVLRKKISAMLKSDNGFSNISQILDFLDENDDIQNSLRKKLEEVLEDLDDLPKNNANWEEFLSSQKQIVVISTSTDSVSKASHLTDMLLASLYSYKQYAYESKYTVILDECQDLYIDTDGPVDVLLRKGGKHGLKMLLASQEFSVAKDKLGKIIGNCGTLVFFRPKADNVSDIAKLTGVDKSMLAGLEQGQCVIHGMFYNKYEHRNKYVTLIGWTYKHKTN